MKFALGYANTAPHHEPTAARDLAIAAEESGFESIWTVEHVTWPRAYESSYPYHHSGKMPGEPSSPIPDPLVWLAWVGAATSEIRLGTGVLILPLHEPLLLAKQAATLDYMTGGRLELGVGVGWLEEEFHAVGVPFDRRGQRTDEYIEALRNLWSSDDASYEGGSVSFGSVASNPKPVNGRVPIVIGGHSRAAARRAARFGDGFYPGPASLERLDEVLQALKDECEKAGRDACEIEVMSAYPGRLADDFESAVETMASHGIDRLIVPVGMVTRPSLDSGMETFRSLAASFT